MPYKLKKLKINRVDLVDKGANQEAHVLLFKRDADAIDKGHTLKEILEMQERREEAYEDEWKVTDAFMESLKSCCDMGDTGERQRIIMESAKQFVEMMAPIEDALKPEEEDMDMSEELQKQLETLQAENAELVKRVEAAEAEVAKRDSEGTEEDIWKGVSPKLREMFEAQQAEVAVAKAAAQAEHDSRVKQECIQKAARYSHLPLNPDDDWEVLKAVDTLDEKIASRIYELFNAGNTNLKESGLTKERGTGGDPDAGGRTAYDDIQRLVNEKVSKSEGGLDFGSALEQVAKENPSLYRSYTSGVKSGKGN